ncbi:MAG: 3-deoxy-7-phosphoheptulonate synthase [Deltaproteobacteria bacterium]|nr:3-deoxy-7-phosphoheptulonate synthase [Deltaproteobacteria bacterium]MBI3386483.1 3-deoxy-7-phosphoheptulonate synthase [Deltaproteobacteria bacterium]
MSERIENANLVDVLPLTPPTAAKAKLPRTERVTEVVLHARRAIRDIIHGRDRLRLLAVVGPCSIHDPEAALDYARRLVRVADAVGDHVVVVMRTYFEKPRTTIGWKGLINDPHLDGSCDIAVGLELARRILLEINELGLPCGYEALDPVTPQYIADLLSWAAIGARTTESQTHRELASGLSMPVGFKNGTDGGLEVALNAMISARAPHAFLGINPDGVTSVVRTGGNPDRHIVLRGGSGKPNYAPADVARAAALVVDEAITRPIMVDCSHDNSMKDHTRQPQVCRDVLAQVRAGQERIMGVLLESNLKPGKQTWKPNVPLAYGVSITDACIGWDDTEALLYEIADAVKRTPVLAASM